MLLLYSATGFSISAELNPSISVVSLTGTVIQWESVPSSLNTSTIFCLSGSNSSPSPIPASPGNLLVLSSSYSVSDNPNLPLSLSSFLCNLVVSLPLASFSAISSSSLAILLL